LSALCPGIFALDKDLILAPVAAGVFITPFFMENPPAGGDFSRDGVNGFDRLLMFPYNRGLDTAGDVLMYGLLAAPLVPAVWKLREGAAFWRYGLMYAEAFMLTHGTKDLLKTAVNRTRPYAYFGPVPAGLEDDFHNSFPSGHTSLAFMSAGFLTAVLLREYPDSPWKTPLVAAAYSLAAAVAVDRLTSGSHFPTDIIAGALIGSLYGHLIPALHYSPRITLIPLPHGLALSYRL
jgi:membrane-associated phospholipid phosphatase